MIEKAGPGRILFNIFNYSMLFLFAVICFYPFWYIIIYSFSDPQLAAQGLSFLPKGFTFENFVQVMQLKGIVNSLFISVARTIIGTALCIFACSFMGYLFSKKEMPMRKFFYRMLIITMYVSGGLIPGYLTISLYGLPNTFWVYIIPGIVSAYNVILVKTFVEQLPASLEESAILDGAGYMTVFVRIIAPLCKPIIATITIFSAVGHWNSWMDNYLYVSDANLHTLQYMLQKFLDSAAELSQLLRENSSAALASGSENLLTPMSVRMSITTLVVLPIFCVYPFMQKYFTKGIMIGAVKG